MRKVKNFARFYACLNTVQIADKEDLKRSLVQQFTNGRTSSLREMKESEYHNMCDSIDPKSQQDLRDKAEIKRHRSAVLRRIQKLGVDTTDWNKVDEFTLNRRIAGKKFYELTIDELEALKVKLIAIARNSPKPKAQPKVKPDNSNRVVYYVDRSQTQKPS